MCIRALDYLPPVDVTFFEYLRALITADFDIAREDRYNYRVAFVEAFRRRGIYPMNMRGTASDTPRTLSVDTLRWQGIRRTLEEKPNTEGVEARYRAVVDALRGYANDCFYIEDRKALFEATEKECGRLQTMLEEAFREEPEFASEMGIDPAFPFEVHELRRAMRTSSDGRPLPQIIVALTQSRRVEEDVDAETPAFTFHGGSTLVVNLAVPEVKYRIFKSIDSDAREVRTAEFVASAAADPLRAFLFGAGGKEPFAILHSLAEDGL
jgi:hypothetical protein